MNSVTPSRERKGSQGAYDLPVHGKSYSRTPCSRRKVANTRSSDRYIPSRSQLRTSLINSMCQSAEKDRLKLTPALRERYYRCSIEISPVSQPNNLTDPEGETADQLSFRRTMGAILHDEQPEDFLVQKFGTKEVDYDGMKSRNTILGCVHPSLRQTTQKLQDTQSSHLAYQSLPDIQSDSIRIHHESSTTGLQRCFSYSTRCTGTKRNQNPFHHNLHQVVQNASTSEAREGMYIDRSRNAYAKRKIPEKPTKVLDAPDIVDDYYLNLISWSRDNILAVAMGPSVYIWNASTGEIGHVVTLRTMGDYVSSVSWSHLPGCSKLLAVGTHSNAIQLWDTEAQKLVRKLDGHTNRVSAMAWNASTKWLTSGGRDSIILQHDHRTQNSVASKFKGHRQEICGLKWNEDGSALASGGNENYLCVWDAAMSQRASRHFEQENSNSVTPRLVLTQHKAAVKALDWYPFNRGVLASGGGSADRTIKFWNTISGTLTSSVDTGSQVCSLLWSKHHRELCSSHGFSENQLILWKYPSMTKVQEFKSHTARVLNMEMSPDGRSVVSVGADETLRFWDIFGAPKDNKRDSTFAIGGFECPGLTTIR